jgi:DDE superfamily endonuclease
VPFGRLVEDVMTAEPCCSARTVFWIVDNGSGHAGQASIDRLEGAYPNLRLIHLPIHASWLNQVELYFSIVQRKALTPNDFDTLDALGSRLLDFGTHYRQIAKPFEWSFTRTDLDRLLARLDDHRPPPRRGITTELADACTSQKMCGFPALQGPAPRAGISAGNIGRPAVVRACVGNRSCPFAGTLARATGLEPATSRVTGRSWRFRAERG